MPSRLARATDAVSPLMATLIMVVMTIVLTAGVLVLLNGVGSRDSGPAPVVVPSKDEAADRVLIIRADGLIPLSRLRIEMSVPGHFAYNSLAGLGSPALPANTLVPLAATGTVTGGDAVFLCANAAASDVQVLLQDPVTNKVVATASFSSLVACA
jgi:FlaG/FlaF family flagellin (archaellin)